MIKKLCSYPGCHKVVEAGVKYCDKHRETDRKKYREYKQRRMRDEQEARRQQFYNSKAWEQFRAAQAAAQSRPGSSTARHRHLRILYDWKNYRRGELPPHTRDNGSLG